MKKLIQTLVLLQVFYFSVAFSPLFGFSSSSERCIFSSKSAFQQILNELEESNHFIFSSTNKEGEAQKSSSEIEITEEVEVEKEESEFKSNSSNAFFKNKLYLGINVCKENDVKISNLFSNYLKEKSHSLLQYSRFRFLFLKRFLI